MKNTVEPPKKEYSRSWAQSVVNTWQRIRPRGAYLLEYGFNVRKGVLVRLLMQGRPEWQVLKDMADFYDENYKLPMHVGFNRVPIESDWKAQKVGIIQKFEQRLSSGLKNYLTANI